MSHASRRAPASLPALAQPAPGAAAAARPADLSMDALLPPAMAAKAVVIDDLHAGHRLQNVVGGERLLLVDLLALDAARGAREIGQVCRRDAVGWYDRRLWRIHPALEGANTPPEDRNSREPAR